MTDRHQAPSYPLRMPADLKEKMTAAAKTSGRSLHAEIVARLQLTFDGNSPSSDLITLSMNDFDAVIEAAVSRALERASLPAHQIKKKD